MLNRRQLLQQGSTGFGLTALAGLMSDPSYGNSRISAAAPPKKAEHVIFCYMSGGVSHVDSFDPKPRLNEEHGKPMPVKVERTMFNNNGNIFGSPFKFRQHGESGLPVSNMFPKIAEHVDDLAVIRSMTSKVSEHAQANCFFHTGFPFLGHPSAGAWVSYGLGNETNNLPGFVVLQSGSAVVPHGGVGMFGNGYLPGQHQASIFKADKPQPIRNITAREHSAFQRSRIDFIKKMDGELLTKLNGDQQIEAAVRNYETAWQMQSSVPELCDISGETKQTHELYGLNSDNSLTAAYGRQALTARRLVERGVPFIELSCLTANIGAGGAANPWDQHGDLEKGHTAMARQVDQPIAALISDLKQRDLLEKTLIVWAGEFGRTPFSQGSNGRDHNPYGFSVWMAGGGIKGGTIYGQTDEYGYHVVENKVTVYDLWATVLHQLGINHMDLTFRHGGRDFRLTDVHGNVIDEILS